MKLIDFKLFEKDTEKYKAPEYVVQPADNDKGFFMFKAQFDSLHGKKKDRKTKQKFSPSIKWKFADEI
jgi:hypothetical protein